MSRGAPGQPIALTAAGVIPFGQSVVLSLFAMQATMLRQPIEVTEVRFILGWATGITGSTTPIFPNPAAYTRVSARVGRYALTNGFVPVGTLNPRLNDAVEFTLAAAASGAYLPYAYAKWRFDHPLPLPLGVGLELTFKSLMPTSLPSAGTDLTASINVTAVMIGRTIQKVPAQFPVPYVAPYVVLPGAQLSAENDFRNLNGATMRTKRIVARTYQRFGTNPAWAEYTQLQPYATPGASTPDAVVPDYTKLISLRVLSPDGKALMTPYAPISSLFPEDTLSMPIEMDLPMARGLTATLSQTPNASTVGGGTDDACGWISMFALHGFRMEEQS